MKKFILFLGAFLSLAAVCAQAPKLFSYQIVVRTNTSVLVSNNPVGIRISILQNTPSGTSLYTELHAPSTNSNGLATFQIGAGTVVSGSFNNIDFGKGPYFLKIEVDPAGGNSYSLVNVNQILSVPYALYAQTSADGWKTNGNEGTSADFIGTVNNQPFNVRVNNIRSGHVGTNGNVFWGKNAGISNTAGHHNVALGEAALFSNEGASEIVALGDYALYNNKGSYNTAIGSKGLFSNTSGYSNTALGNQVMYSNTDGSYNVAVGHHAMYFNSTGNYNTATGYQALYSNTTGQNNVAFGLEALNYNTTGYSNSATGYKVLFATTTGAMNTGSGTQALYSTTTGNGNTGIGYGSLYANNTGSNNTALGSGADVTAGNLSNATAIGYQTKVNASNKVRIGNENVTVIEGQVPFSNTSDARFKYNIQPNVPGLAFIKRLQPVTYYFNEEKLEEYSRTGIVNNHSVIPVSNKERELHTGFLAQDVEKIANELGYHFDGVRAPADNKSHYSLAYSQFIMPLVKGMQEQQVMIEQLDKENKQQKQINEEQRTIIEQLQASLKKLEVRMDKQSGN